ncbi:CopL family metal-binding regulatory protein [Stenotrophomonas sp. TWI143]|uniref:CopL family metal-binding regulatory protein n=1 Tax=Stenotrophomonas TaxID=40323 RepID=UPI0018D415D9|nr:CopL family metal-binding regulatory protein [Stenotrophomonas maltophilia]MBH1836884.1 CopL family metal-binding regulatory protein [Stenotrophomonas maltophilia]MCU1093416.1 CopL family metal-binding regulatory protein [Stenotrophomonas maltophilia]HDS1219237.1 CopL family metal-binding regulatory protein [Stenotrophomonas maltophilia]HDS1232293.1 CopL family metal-binding regulatory protein [Stenotrophomonas maltophilia]HDS1556717.1 CopL family metal-binding regulatory protein [Stenotrop
MPYRRWLPLLLMAVLLFEGVFGAWAGTRMALPGGDAAGSAGRAIAGCQATPRSAAPASGHTRHDQAPVAAGDVHKDHCSCVDAAGCDCRCLLSLYPPMPSPLLPSAHPRIALDIALPALILPASKLSRVFRPPIA